MKLALIAAFASLPLVAADCRELEKLSKLNEAHACYEALVASRSNAQRAEGYWGLRRYDDANVAFRIAVREDPKNPAVRVRWGRLLLERFNLSDAQALFMEALEMQPEYPPAVLALAVSLTEGFDRKAVEFARKAVELDPKLVEAQELVAALVLEDGDFKKAAEEAQTALKISPNALDAMAVLAAIDLLDDKPSSEWTTKMLAASPKYGQGYARIARWFVLNRRYEEAIGYYRKALELDNTLEPARAELGVTMMRVGNDLEARKLLEEAYQNGYRNKSVANSLTLLDSYKNFDTIKTPHAILKLHKKESQLLRPYVEYQVERSIAAFQKKYGVTLKGPVQVEMYPDHEDFAVRTMGMPGLGALGVTFVLSIAMDSPSGRAPGTYHWASTLWHEMSHVFTLQATNHRVPRWFTEGLAVHEETAVNKEWGERVTPDVLKAMRDKKLLPIAELDRGFVRPSHAGQIVVSYFQAGRVCDYINEKYGWPTLMAMLKEFAKVETTANVVERTLKIKPEEFDKQFIAWLEAQHAASLKGYDEFIKGLGGLNQAMKAARWDDVLAQGKKLKPLLREYVDPGNVYEAMAAAYNEKGDKTAAVNELREYVAVGGRHPRVLKLLAANLEEQNKKDEARAVLERILWIYPVNDQELHKHLGDLRAEASDWSGAAQEYAAVVALKPSDPATAHYNLARAYYALNNLNDAEEQILLSLESAPGYRPAQKLLLELSEKKKN